MKNDIMDVMQVQTLAYIYEPHEILINIAFSFILGMIISYVYKVHIKV